MVENLIVALIVGASAWYAGARYLPASVRRRLGQKPAAGCGSGCDTCNNCATGDGEGAPARQAALPSVSPTGHRTITLHKL